MSKTCELVPVSWCKSSVLSEHCTMKHSFRPTNQCQLINKTKLKLYWDLLGEKHIPVRNIAVFPNCQVRTVLNCGSTGIYNSQTQVQGFLHCISSRPKVDFQDRLLRSAYTSRIHLTSSGYQVPNMLKVLREARVAKTKP